MFANKLRELRIQHGLTQAQLANKLDIGISTIGMYESNIRKPSFEVLIKIANYFNVSVDYLIDDNSNTNVDESIKIATKLKSLSPEQLAQIKSFINFIMHNPPK